MLANLPYVREDEWKGLAPEITDTSRVERWWPGPTAWRRSPPPSRRPSVRCEPGASLALEVGAGQAGAVAELLLDLGLRQVEGRQDLAGIPRVVLGTAVTTDASRSAATGARSARRSSSAASSGAAWPSSRPTRLYGLGCDPSSAAAIERIHSLKGRDDGKPSAVMFFTPLAMRELVATLGPRTRDALGALLPGPVTLVVGNPERRYPLACREAIRSGSASG